MERRVARAASPGCTAWSATNSPEPPLTHSRDLAQLAAPHPLGQQPTQAVPPQSSVHSAHLPTITEIATALALPESQLVLASQPDPVSQSLNTCAIPRNAVDALATVSTALRRASLSPAISGELPACPVICIMQLHQRLDRHGQANNAFPVSYHAPTATAHMPAHAYRSAVP